MKALRYSLIGLAAVLLLLVAVAAYFAATFDPNAYKPQIVALVKEKTGRTLTLEGDIGLSLWPSLGAKVGRMSLTEPNSDKRFAAMESAQVSLKLLPLLSRNYVVDELAIKGLRATVVKGKAGATNVDDLLGKPQPSQPEPERKQVAFDIAHVALDDAAIEYRDETTGAQYALSGLTLKTGRIAPDVPTRVELKSQVRSNKPKVDLAVEGKTRLTFNLDRGRYALDGLALALKGEAAEYTGIDAKASGDVAAAPKAGEFSTDKLAVSASATRGKEKLELKLDAPRLAMKADTASGEKITLALTTAAPEGATTLKASVPGIEGTASNFRSPAVTLDFERRQPEQTVKAHVTSPLTGNLEAKQFALPQLEANVTVSGPKLPGPGLSGELAGSASVDGTKERAQANLAGKLGDSAMKARIAVAGFTPLALDFDVDLDRLDLDRYAGSKPKPKAQGGGEPPAGKPAAGAPAPQREEPIDLTALRDLRATGSLRVGSLATSGLKASNVRVAVKARDGRLELNPLSAALYEGTLAGAVTIDAAGAAPAFALRQTLTGVQVGPLLRDLADKDVLEGKGNVTVNVTTRGNTVSALKKALDGKAAVKLNDGAVKGIDIAGAIRKGEAMLSSLRGQPAQQQSDARQRTDFSELSASFDIRNGVARNDDLSIKSPLLRVGGAGAVDIGEDSLDYTVKASLVATAAGQGGKERSDLRGITVPVRVSGPIASPSYRLDFNAMVADTARQKVQDAVTKELERRLGGRTGETAPAQPQEGQSGRRALEESLRGLFRK